MDLPISKLLAVELYGGSAKNSAGVIGVPVRDGAGNKGSVIGVIANLTHVMIPNKQKLSPDELSEHVDNGWIQVTDMNNEDPVWSNTGECWIEDTNSHIRPVPPVVSGKKRYKVSLIDMIVEIEELP